MRDNKTERSDGYDKDSAYGVTRPEISGLKNLFSLRFTCFWISGKERSDERKRYRKIDTEHKVLMIVNTKERVKALFTDNAVLNGFI